jgi:hypothetical protein
MKSLLDEFRETRARLAAVAAEEARLHADMDALLEQMDADLLMFMAATRRPGRGVRVPGVLDPFRPADGRDPR